jgi:hypothetical protein
VLWRLSDYEKILQRVHDSHDAAIAVGKATTTKHSATQAVAIDMTMPFSPDAATQSASPEPTPQPAAAATQPLSAIITLLSYHPFVFKSREWMRLNDPSGTPYFVNTSTLQLQVDPPASGEIVHIAEPRVTRAMRERGVHARRGGDKD